MAVKHEQVLIIEPESELKFRGPFNVAVTSNMKLTNPSDKTVVFKIKTTAPKKYCVRPNSGVLAPQESVELAICLQPFIFDPNEKNKHKFMVQSMYAPDSDINLEQIWKDITPDQLMDSKLRCVFEMPEQKIEPTEETVVKTSPPKAPLSAAANILASTQDDDGDQQETAFEMQRVEVNGIKMENLRLKELLSKCSCSASGVKTSPPKYSPPVQDPQIPLVRLVFSVLIVIFGIVLGKYVL